MRILIALPAYNEELILGKNILTLLSFCRHNLKDDYKLVIADNASADRTGVIGQELAKKHSEIDYLFIPQKGKGMAIRAAWQKYEADYYCFMDMDLATDLSALPVLINEIKGGSDVVIGSRFHRLSAVSRSLKRKLISLVYHYIIKIIFKLKINDLPCGFKAINNQVKINLLPQIKNNNYFFDSELVILADKAGYKIKEIPISWSDYRQIGRKSTVNVFDTAVKYLKEVWRLRKRLKKL